MGVVGLWDMVTLRQLMEETERAHLTEHLLCDMYRNTCVT